VCDIIRKACDIIRWEFSNCAKWANSRIAPCHQQSRWYIILYGGEPGPMIKELYWWQSNYKCRRYRSFNFFDLGPGQAINQIRLNLGWPRVHIYLESDQWPQWLQNVPSWPTDKLHLPC
jgi:hypothetical protein